MIAYLWTGRERPDMSSRRWFKVLANQALRLTDLVRMLSKRYRFAYQGMQIGPLDVVYKFTIQGALRRISIGSESFVASRSVMAPLKDIFIGKRTVINDGVTILTASHSLADPHWRMYAKAVRIEDYARIASNATILPSVHIGEGAVVGTVVRSNVPLHTIVIGNPAQPTGKRRVSNLNYNPALFCAPLEAWVGKMNETKLVGEYE